jgi:hypothetical protein
MVVLLPACTVDLHEEMGPRVPIPNVIGGVQRLGIPCEGVKVDLRTAEGDTTLDSDRTDAQGRFGFAIELPGRYEIKARGSGAEDFESVTLAFEFPNPDSSVVLPTVELDRRGTAMTEPAPGDTVTLPTLTTPLWFHWVLPETAYLWARVQVYDAEGHPVWFSPKRATDRALWNGLGNQSAYMNQFVTPGHYTWRVKVAFPDSSEGRLARWELALR